MAMGQSKVGAFLGGGAVGLAFSALFAVGLALIVPLESGAPGPEPAAVSAPAPAPEPPAEEPNTVEDIAEAPAPEEVAEAAPAPAETRAPAPEPVAEVAPAPETSEPANEEPAEVSEAAEPTPEPAPAPEPEVAAAPEPEPAAAPAIVTNSLSRNAERYLGDPDAPMLTIVIDDVGLDEAGLADIFLLPAPITVVVPTSAPGAAALMAEARDAGFEALKGVDAQTLVEGPAALAAELDSDAPVIGVALGGGEPDAVTQAALATALQERGMGLLDLTAEGGGPLFRIAQNAGVAAAPLGRRVDEIPSSAAVYQALERAAFDARRTGAFVVVARPEPATLTGLRRWMNVKANKSVTVAPLSAVLRKLAR